MHVEGHTVALKVSLLGGSFSRCLGAFERLLTAEIATGDRMHARLLFKLVSGAEPEAWRTSIAYALLRAAEELIE